MCIRDRYNIGTINTENLICANSSVFFNAGSVNIKDKLSAENASSTISVSYTHLDVYKRQREQCSYVYTSLKI